MYSLNQRLVDVLHIVLVNTDIYQQMEEERILSELVSSSFKEEDKAIF